MRLLAFVLLAAFASCPWRPKPPDPLPPDRDHDGVPDATDRCPDVAGPAENQGCPIEVPPEVPPKDVYVYGELQLRADGAKFTRGGKPHTPKGASQCCAPTVIDAATGTADTRSVRRPKPIYPYRTVYPRTAEERARGVRAREVLGTTPNSRWPSMGKEVQDYFARYGRDRWQGRLAPYLTDADHEGEWSDIGGPYVLGTSNFNEPHWEFQRGLTLHAGSIRSNVEAVFDSWWLKYCKQYGAQHCAWPASDVQAFGVTVTPEHRRFLRKMVETFTCNGAITWGVGNEEALVPGARREFFEQLFAEFRAAEQDFPCLMPDGTRKPVVHMISNNAPEWASGPYDIATTHTRAPLTEAILGKPTELNEFNPGWPPAQWFSIYCDALAKGLSVWLWRDDSTDAELQEMLQLSARGCGDVPQECFAPDANDPLWTNPVPGSSDQRDEIDAAKAVVGERCGSVPPHEGAFPTLAAVAQELRKAGHCASGPWGDALVEQEDSDPRKFGEWHLVRYTDGCWAVDPAQLPKNIWTYNGTPPTHPAPACGDPVPPPLSRWSVKEHTKGPNWTTVDSTPLVGPDAAYCASIGFTDGRSFCSVRQEGAADRKACEALVVGTPQWSGPGSVSPENAYLWLVPRGTSGTVTVCGQREPVVCGSVEVTP